MVSSDAPLRATADRPLVAIGALGGTIAMTASDAGGVTPSLSAADLVTATPGLEDEAEIVVETLARLSSAALDERIVLSALDWARTVVDDGAVGAVLTQGTDTLEETAYLLDLLWDRPEPLVLTGAMRAPEAAGADGPANLLTAVRCAVEPASRGRGVLVAMAEEIHDAARVAKADSMSPAAFVSPGFGPVGRSVEEKIRYATPAGRRQVLDPPTDTGHRVALIAAHLGDDGRLLRLVADEPDLSGVVIAALGAGHVSPSAAEAIGALLERVPVVFATRAGAGPTATRTYGYPGSEMDLRRRGAVGAGWLSPQKARLLLWVLTAGGAADPDAVRDAVVRHGAL